jgi:flagellar motor component MotA
MSDKLSYKFSIYRFVATAGVSVIVGWMMSLGGDAGIYLHLPTLAIVFGICFFLLLGSYGADFLKFIPASLMSLAFSPSRPSPRYAEIAKFGSRYVIAGGVICGLMSIIMILQNLSDPHGIGPMLTFTLIGTFHAVLASELFFALVYKAFSDSSPGYCETKPLPLSNVLGPLVVFGLALGIFFMFFGIV